MHCLKPRIADRIRRLVPQMSAAGRIARSITPISKNLLGRPPQKRRSPVGGYHETVETRKRTRIDSGVLPAVVDKSGRKARFSRRMLTC
jgi:hypothetical protein